MELEYSGDYIPADSTRVSRPENGPQVKCPSASTDPETEEFVNEIAVDYEDKYYTYRRKCRHLEQDNHKLRIQFVVVAVCAVVAIGIALVTSCVYAGILNKVLGIIP